MLLAPGPAWGARSAGAHPATASRTIDDATLIHFCTLSSRWCLGPHKTCGCFHTAEPASRLQPRRPPEPGGFPCFVWACGSGPSRMDPVGPDASDGEAGVRARSGNSPGPSPRLPNPSTTSPVPQFTTVMSGLEIRSGTKRRSPITRSDDTMPQAYEVPSSDRIRSVSVGSVPDSSRGPSKGLIQRVFLNLDSHLREARRFGQDGTGVGESVSTRDDEEDRRQPQPSTATGIRWSLASTASGHKLAPLAVAVLPFSFSQLPPYPVGWGARTSGAPPLPRRNRNEETRVDGGPADQGTAPSAGVPSVCPTPGEFGTHKKTAQ